MPTTLNLEFTSDLATSRRSVAASAATPAPKIRCRQIVDHDLEQVADVLAAGFPRRNRSYWTAALQYLRERDSPAGFPRYGYILTNGQQIVGVLLLIFVTREVDGATSHRCNVSSWYVIPEFRNFAPLLVLPPLRHKDVTFLNTSPAYNTLQTIEAQGFQRLSNGVFLAIPALSFRFPDGRIIRLRKSVPLPGTIPAAEASLLRDHAERGCLSLVWQTRQQCYPFVFRRRLVRHRFRYGWLPCAQLIYCSGLDRFVEVAGPIGRYLAVRGMPVVLIGGNGPIENLSGRYYDEKNQIYYRGPQKPTLGDLAYTEAALFGD